MLLFVARMTTPVWSRRMICLPPGVTTRVLRNHDEVVFSWVSIASKFADVGS